MQRVEPRQQLGRPQLCSDSVLLSRTWAERLKRSREDYFTEPPMESYVAPAFSRQKHRVGAAMI